ncbi:MAG: HDOD domain-containing protein [Melioribacteraceae bacterium]|nr:HDOD domain-containing protein [Melioribacteraceae bacterium]MCF8355150.1 HDOD domain-containing protein [Melioribacteraceae bacterium]MCF8392479.1 HDOD domain-containing protein [Melioribacteraceae bacterium]MCF8418390.1 HDOD domain-containing protein [Melioribacteraceae bacterium]
MENQSTLQAEKNKANVIYKLSAVHSLPTMPFLVSEVTRLIDNPMTSAANLGRLIGKDQGMVTKILSVANSPLYGIPRRVSTIDFAIVILGFNHIKNIVIALSMMNAFKNISGKDFRLEKYWAHSLMTATAAKRIADDLGYQLGGEAFTAGLLHDLGIPIIYRYFRKEYMQIEKIISDLGGITEEGEENIIGATHSFIGHYLINQWNLPSEISSVVLQHHNPSASIQNDKVLASIVHLADYLTWKLDVGNFHWDNNFLLDSNIIDILKLGSIEYLDGLAESYRELFEAQLDTIKL